MRVLVADDEKLITSLAEKALRNAIDGIQVDSVLDGQSALQKLQEGDYDVFLTDQMMPDINGLELLQKLREKGSLIPVILMTGYGNPDITIEAGKLGVYEFLAKPFDVQGLVTVVRNAAASYRMAAEPVNLGQTQERGVSMIGKSDAMRHLYLQIGKFAASPVSVLITGPTGSGKELVARALYQHSNRSKKPFIAINCAAIPETLLESELFGHEKGAFTGADRSRVGRFEQAEGGTIFLDEIAEMTPSTQAKLLRVLQEKEIQRLGGRESIPIDVRVLAATHQDLLALVESKKFREDLYYRLCVVKLEIPSLSERTEDVPLLVDYFLSRHGVELGFPRASIAKDALEYLSQQNWPGNVRQLENLICELILVSRDHPIGMIEVQQATVGLSSSARESRLADLASIVSTVLKRAESGQIEGAYEALSEIMEKELYQQAHRLARGNRSHIARLLGVSRPTVQDKLETYKIGIEDFEN